VTALANILLIFLCALALMALEAFIPGVSLAGMAAVGLFGFAAYLCWDVYGVGAAIILIGLAAVFSFLIVRLLMRSMKNGKLSKTGLFMHEGEAPAVKKAAHEGQIKPGSIGSAQSALRPSGIAEFDRQRVHVISENGFIEKNEKVIATRIEGARIVVRKMTE